MDLQELYSIPPGLLETSPRELYRILSAPSLIHLPGRKPSTLFVSVLLHGNEDSSLYAIQKVLRKYQDQTLPRAMSVFFANVQAARFGMRHLDGQPDFNRIWPPGGEAQDSEEAFLMAQVVDAMARRQIFASIDVHNNTGHNPHYACINRLDDTFLQLARLFGRTVVYFTRPKGVQSMAFASLCPATTLECGKTGQEAGAEHAFKFIDACLHMAEMPDYPLHHSEVDIYQTSTIVHVRDHVSFSFTDHRADLLLDPQLEFFNFRPLEPGTLFGRCRSDAKICPLMAVDLDGQDITDQYFAVHEAQIFLKRACMPSMLTLDETVIQQDCVCYIMQAVELPQH